ncbi:MAG: alanine racemase [Phormidesmis sp.]
MRRARAWVEIDLNLLANNVRQIKALLPAKTALMSVVKADAYGHGAVDVAKTVLGSGATWLGVATVIEGIELRLAGVEAPILVFGAIYDPVEIKAIAQWNLQPTIVSPDQARLFSETLEEIDHIEIDRIEIDRIETERRLKTDDSTSRKQRPKLPVHLMVDTGMSRLGFPWQRSVEFARSVQQLPRLKAVGLYSHLATADSLDLTTMQLQQTRFEQAIADLTQANLCPPQCHLANSAATLIDQSLHYDMVRVGLAIYGLYPAPHLRAKVSLQPVLAVKARITQIKEIAAGEGVSYSHKFIAPNLMRIAVVGIGYADGVPRILSGQMKVAIANQLVRQLGAITMDQIMLDISTLKSAQAGDIVTLLGASNLSASNLGASKNQQLSADHWAELAATISWEILCGFKQRLPRISLPQTPTTPASIPTSV